MDYKNYQNARDAAWRILLDCEINSLPVSLNTICRRLNIRVLTYGDNWKVLEQLKLAPLAQKTDGMTFYVKKTPIVLFNETTSPQRAKFTVAHEVGHIILEHVGPGRVTAANRDPHPGDAPEETAANQFAARLLAPACVLWGLGVKTPEEIMNLCQISRQAAVFRAERMKELYQRDKFLTAPLEQEVYRQFQSFIQEALHSSQED